MKIATSYESSGVLALEPDGWLYISVDTELTRYYISRYNRSRAITSGQIMKPKNGGHISIVRPAFEAIPADKADILDDLIGTTIGFSYDTELKDNGRHFWLSVVCEQALDIRERLGMSRHPQFPLHLTIGVTDISWLI